MNQSMFTAAYGKILLDFEEMQKFTHFDSNYNPYIEKDYDGIPPYWYKRWYTITTVARKFKNFPRVSL